MVQGTASHVGKSRIVEALCRLLADKGIRVAPFKAQNMALNSAVTWDGKEIGRSTAEQAAAARIRAQVEMNPLLLKPKTDTTAQLLVMGKPYGDFTAADNFKHALKLTRFKRQIIQAALKKLASEFELIVIEGAGSPAEVNLRRFDIVNMDVAKFARASVLLVADIDKGGSLASLVGTLALLKPGERKLVKGLLLNKFRGDLDLLRPALSFLRRETGIPVLGVLPFHRGLDCLAEEDALGHEVVGDPTPDIDIAIVYHPHLANFTDFGPLAMEPGVRLRYVRTPRFLGNPDALLLPGTKNTSGDLLHLHRTGLFQAIRSTARKGIPVVGICGGYQMLGKRLLDPSRLESATPELEGLGLLETETTFRVEKQITPVAATPVGNGPFLAGIHCRIDGYEIHHGLTKRLNHLKPAFQFSAGGRKKAPDGAVSQNGRIFGTYLHDLFSNDLFRRNFVDVLRKRKGLPPLNLPLVNIRQETENAVDGWASVVAENLDIQNLLRFKNNV